MQDKTTPFDQALTNALADPDITAEPPTNVEEAFSAPTTPAGGPSRYTMPPMRQPLSARYADKKRKKEEFRRAELQRSGLSKEQVEQKLAQEHYEGLSIDQKMRQLEAMVARGFQGLIGDIQSLRHNDEQIATTLDINFRAMARALTKLGLAPDQQMELIKESQAEIEAELKAAVARDEAARAEAQRKMQEQQVEKQVDEKGEAPPIPEAATVFGG